MEIKITIPEELEQDALDAFSYNDKEFQESKKTKNEWIIYLINCYVKEVVEDYIVNIKSLEQIRQVQDDVKEQIRQNNDFSKILTTGAIDDTKRN
jgi:predicted DNA-binding protein